MVSARVSVGQLRFGSLEGLRAVMAWWVVIGHIANVTGISSLTPSFMSPLWNGTVAVNVFILLSGFVITHLLLSPNRPSYGRYLTRRAFRLWPAYLLALIPMIAIPALYAYPYVELPWHSEHDLMVERYDSVHANVAPHAVLHLTMLHGLVPGEVLEHADSSLLSPAWSLSLEWQFYIVAPLLVALMLRSRRAAIGVVGASAATTIAFCSQSFLSWDFRSFLLVSIVFFALGMFSRIYVQQITAALRSWLAVVMQVVIVIAALVVVDGFTDFTLGRELAFWFIAMHAVANDIGASKGQNRPDIIGAASAALLSSAPLRHLGEISYSTYIIHIPVICAWFWLFGRGNPDLSQGEAIAIGLTSVGPVYLASLASHRLVERPFMRFGARLTRPRAPKERALSSPVRRT